MKCSLSWCKKNARNDIEDNQENYCWQHYHKFKQSERKNMIISKATTKESFDVERDIPKTGNPRPWIATNIMKKYGDKIDLNELKRTMLIPRVKRYKKPCRYCPKGHEFTPSNTFYTKAGVRLCHMCAKKRDYLRLLRKKAERIRRYSLS